MSSLEEPLGLDKLPSMSTIDRIQRFSSGACCRPRVDNLGMGNCFIDGRSCSTSNSCKWVDFPIYCKLTLLHLFIFHWTSFCPTLHCIGFCHMFFNQLSPTSITNLKAIFHAVKIMKSTQQRHSLGKGKPGTGLEVILQVKRLWPSGGTQWNLEWLIIHCTPLVTSIVQSTITKKHKIWHIR